VKVDPREIERRLESFKTRVREAGVKLTHQRIEIFREVAASLEHPDAEAILKAVKPRMPTVSLDTVYRTLWLLSDLGLVATLGPRRQSVRFDANLKDHHHYVCERCGLVRDFDSAELDEIRVPAAVKAFGTIIRAQVEIRGICEKCAQKPGGQSPPLNRKQQKGRLRKT
jgi:Fur family transcriptional regulator, peroxide stress response regulator